VLLRCVTPEEVRELLLDIHGGIYAHYVGSHTLMGNTFKHGFYWLTTLVDARDLVKMCKGCQYYAKQSNLLTQALQTISITWPFAV
jgi:hypothetical protein